MATEHNFKVKKGLDVLGGDVNLGDGFAYKIDGTTVVDSSRNLSNIGTISSGTITTSGNLVLDSSGYNYIELHSSATNTRKWRFYNGQHWNQDALLIYDQDADSTVLTIETNKLGVNRGAASLSHNLDVGGTVAISGTQIIDGSRNLTNIGTISSGTITSSGNINASSGHINTANQYLNGAIRVLNSAGDGWNVFANRTSAGIFDLSSIGTLSTSGNITTGGTITASGSSGSSFYALQLSRSGSGTATPDIWGTNGTLVIGTSSTDEVLGMSGTAATFYGNLSVTGNLTVSGTQTTLNTTTLQVEDKNIVLNYGTGDTSSSANGAGITIQDAVDSSTDATITWSQAGGNFNVSHGWNSLGYLQHSGVLYSRNNLVVLNSAGNGWNTWATRSNGQFNLSVGTISSGAITTTTGAITVRYGSTPNISLTPTSTGGVINARNSSGTSVVAMDARGTPFLDVTGNLKTSGTVRIDSSGNATLGTISSGAITSGTVTVDGEVAVSPSTGTAKVRLTSQGAGSEVFTVNGQRPGVSNTGFAIRNETDSRNDFMLDGSGNATFAGTISSGALSATGNSTITGSGSSGLALNVYRGSDGATALRVLNTGEVVVGSNYFYVDASQGAYFNGEVRVRGGISNDGTNFGGEVRILDDTNIVGALKINGTQAIDSSRNLTNIAAIAASGDISTAAANYASTYRHQGDSDTYLNFPSDNVISLVAGGSEIVRAYQTAGAYGVLQVTGTGSATYPNFTFAGDTDTGIYASAANQLAFTTGGTKALEILSTNEVIAASKIISQGGHSDARIAIEYRHGGATNNANNADLLLWASEPGITYRGVGIGANINHGGQYYGRADNSHDYGAYMRWDANSGVTEWWTTTGSAGTAGGQGTRRMTLGNSGNLNLLTGSLQINSVSVIDTNRRILAADGAANVPYITFAADTNTGIWRPGDDRLAISTGGGERLRIDNSGNLLLGQHTTTTPGSGNTTAGASIRAGGSSFFAVSQGPAQYLSRYTDEGAFLVFRYNNAEVGTIGVSGGNNLYITGTQTNHAGLTFATDSVLPTRQSSITNGVTDLGQNGSTFRHIWMGDEGVLYFGDANHYIFGGASLSGGDMRIRASDDISLYSRWVRYHDDTGSAGEYARISYNGSWINSNLSVNGNIKIGASGGGTTIIDTSRNLTNIGTISSGAITSTGNMSLTGELDITKSGSTHSLVLGNRDAFADSSSDSLIWITSGSGTFKNGQGAHLVFEGRKDSRNFYFKVGNVTAPQHIMHNSGYVGFGTGDITPTDRVHVDGTVRASSYKIGTTEVINSSGQFTGGLNPSSLSIGGTTVINSSRVGTFVSGTTIGSIELDGNSIGIQEAGILFQPNSSYRCIHPTSMTATAHTSDISLGWSNNKWKDIYLAGFVKADSGYQVGTTTVIDSSRNLTNIGTISSGAITTTGILTVDTSPSANGTGDLKIIPTLNSASGVGYAGQVIGVNIEDTVNTSNQPEQNSTWGGVTGATAIALQADDNSYGQFQVWTSPQSSSAGTALTPRFWIDGIGDATFSRNIKINGTTVIDSNRNLTNIGTISSGAITSSGTVTGASLSTSGNAIIGTNLYFGGATNGSLIQQASTNLNYMADGANIFKTYSGSWGERARIDDNGLTMASSKGISSDGTGRQYNWRALANSSTSAGYVKIARIYGNQSVRFVIELVGRSTSYGDGSLGALGYIVGQLNNDNNYDIVYYNHLIGSSEVVSEVGQVDVDALQTDIYVQVGNFSELSAHAHISHGYITTHNTLSTSQPTGYTAANSEARVFNSKTNITMDSGTSLVHNGTTVLDSSRNLTNIGTIGSSGRHTITGGGTGEILLKIGSSTQTQYVDFQMASNSGLGELFKNGTAYTSYGGASSFNMYNSNGLLAFHPSNTANVLQIDTTGLNVGASRTIRMNGTTVIDSNRRLTPAGIQMSTDTGLYATDATLSYYSSTNAVYLNGAGPNGWLRLNAAGSQNDVNTINIFGSNAGANITFRTAGTQRMNIDSNGNLRWGSANTAILDASRNLTNIGTISSGATTVNGVLTVGGTAAGTEGGELRFTFGSSTTLSGSTVNNDLAGNNVRWFESGGNTRGAYIDISTCENNATSKIWHSGNDGTGSGLDADTVDGIQAASTIHKFSNTGYYRPDTWIDFQSSNGAGLYWAANTGAGWHIHPISTAIMRMRSGSTTQTFLELNTTGTGRGYVYANNSNDVGFLNEAQSWRIRVQSAGSVYMGASQQVRINSSSTTAIVEGSSTHLVFRNTGSGSISFQKSGGTALGEFTNSGNLNVLGNVTAYGSPSDINLKENIQTIPNAVEKVQKLDGITFNYKKDGGRSTGLIAQQLQEVLPEVVYTAKDLEGEEHLAVRYGNVVGLLVEAIKEQQTQLTAQQEQINQLTILVNKLMEK